MELDPHTERELRNWLLSREMEIALGIEDFDELRSVFNAVVGRSPKQ